MPQRIAGRLNVPRGKDDQSAELAEETPVDEIAGDLKARGQEDPPPGRGKHSARCLSARDQHTKEERNHQRRKRGFPC